MTLKLWAGRIRHVLLSSLFCVLAVGLAQPAVGFAASATTAEASLHRMVHVTDSLGD